MKHFHNLYLKYDVLLSSDLFENFRSNFFKNYVLYLRHYLHAPCLSWNAVLDATKIQLNLMSDFDMNMFLVKEMKGGVS